MKLWVDSQILAPTGYVYNKDIAQAKANIALREGWAFNNIECISVGHDGIEFLKWLENAGFNYPIHIHSEDSVNIEKIREIIKRNGWEEV